MMASAAPMDYGAPPDDEDLDDLLEQHYDDMEPPSFDEEDNMPEEGEDVMEPNAANPLPMSLGQIEEEETPEVEEAEDEEEEEEESGAASNPSSVRMQLARARSNQRDIFQFERYTKGSSWRQESRADPDTMQAKRFVATTRLLRRVHQDSNSPESILLRSSHFSSNSNSNKPNSKKRISHRRCKSRPGQSTVPMTFGDGARIYWVQQARNTADASSNSTNATTGTSTTPHPLGESMTTLLHRVRRMRVQKERAAAAAPERSTTAPSYRPTSLWVDKHAPRSFAHLLTDERTNREVLRAMKAWDPFVFGRDPPPRAAFTNAHVGGGAAAAGLLPFEAAEDADDKRPPLQSRVIFLSGPAGLGKTTLAHFVARHCGYRPLEVNASDDRSAAVLKEHVLRAMDNTLDFDGHAPRPNCLILDEIDGAEAALPTLISIIRTEAGKKQEYLKRPIIFIGNSVVRALLPYARHFYVQAPSPRRLVTRLQGILQAEHLQCNTSHLHSLVASTAGDVRSCLHTLQFAASASSDLNASLEYMLQGGKDARNYVTGVIQGIFRRDKKHNRTVDRVLDMADRLGESSRLLDCIFGNLVRVPYMDPTLDRCAAVHEWVSSCDLAFGALHLPATAGVAHLLCRVETSVELIYTNPRPVPENLVVQNFCEGLRLSPTLAVREIIPYALWILSAGGALQRAATSIELLSADEKTCFNEHVRTLVSLGLTYQHGELEPAIHEVMPFVDVNRPEISPAMKEMLSRAVVLEKINIRRLQCTAIRPKNDSEDTCMPDGTSNVKAPHGSSLPKKRRSSEGMETVRIEDFRTLTSAKETTAPEAKRPKVVDFLGMGARKAKAARSARTAARVGVHQRCTKRLSHTGSGMPLTNVVRLKYVKGFTQAVRTPCRVEDLK